MAMRGLKRIAPEVARKFPVTVEMLRAILRELSPLGVDGRPVKHQAPAMGSHEDDTVVYTAVVTGFFYLLRSSEYLYLDGVGFDDKKAVRGEDAQLVGDRLTLRIRGSKTDQYNLGCVRSQHRSGDDLVCPVRAWEALFAAFPARRLGGSESHLPVFRFKDGSGFHRSAMQAWLERGAVAEGLPPGRYGSHSLRIGGATALYNACREVETVKRYGRWSSASFSLYLWEAADATEGLSRDMVKSEGNLELTHGLGAQVAQQQHDARRVRFLLTTDGPGAPATAAGGKL